MTLWRASIITCLSLLLGACGFSLRDNDILAAKLSELRLSMAQPNSDLAHLLRRNLAIASITITDDVATASSRATPVLHLGNERLETRPISVNPRARAAQYEIRLSVEASLTRSDQVLMAPESLWVERNFFEDIENIAGNQEELNIIAGEMRRDLVNQLLRRLEAIPF